jgi:hypothetical protein
MDLIQINIKRFIGIQAFSTFSPKGHWGASEFFDHWDCICPIKSFSKEKKFTKEETQKLIEITEVMKKLWDTKYSKLYKSGDPGIEDEDWETIKKKLDDLINLPSIQKDLQFIEEQKKKHGEKWASVLLEEAKKNEGQGKKTEKKKFWKFWT